MKGQVRTPIEVECDSNRFKRLELLSGFYMVAGYIGLSQSLLYSKSPDYLLSLVTIHNVYDILFKGKPVIISNNV